MKSNTPPYINTIVPPPLKLEIRHQGAIGESGRFTGYIKDKDGNEKKDATYDYQHIDWERHFKGEKYLGLSPVKIIQNGTGRIGVCRWVAWDLDFEETPETFCRAVFKIATDLFCYRTSSNRWHIYKYYDEEINVEEARKVAVNYEVKFKKAFGKLNVDHSHSLPRAYNVAEGKPGYWMFQPYCPHEELKNKNLCGYSPSGQPLTKEQIEFAIHWRKHPIIRSMVGAVSGQGGREKFLFMAKMVIEHNNLILTEEDVNAQFTNKLEEPQLTKEINSHDKKDYQSEYTKQYLEDRYEKYLKEINGYWRKDLPGVGVLDGFINPEQEGKAKQFLKNIIYIKNDDLWYDKSTGQEYNQKALQVTYGHIWGGKISDVITNFVAFEGAQLVEKTVYRPDLFKTIEDPIVKDEKSLLQLNIYRPGEIKETPPNTPKVKQHIEDFKE